MIESKKCKGNGVAKGYGCSTLVPVSLYNKPNRIYGLGKSCGCYSDWLLTSEQGKIVLEKAKIKASVPRKQLETAKTTRNNQNTLKSLLTNVRMQLHAYIRERDKGKPCISCGVEWNDTFHCTHFYKSELYSNLRFDVDNLHGGCTKCNLFMEGNESGYRVGLINRYGKDFVNNLDKKAIAYKKQDFKWDLERLKKIKTEIQQLKKQL